MRAAAILGLGCTPKYLKPFQAQQNVEWMLGLPPAREQADVVLLFGGDGTVHRHLAALVRLGLPLLVVPAGSGNDFAHSLGLRSVRDSLAAWKEFCAGAENGKAIDLGMITGSQDADEASTAHSHYFCCVAGVGLDGEVARRANSMPRWLRGHGGYILSVLPTIFSFAPLGMKILTPTGNDEQKAAWSTHRDQPTLLAVFANSPVYGGGMKVAPQAKMDDGLLDICSVGSIAPFRLLRLFPTVYRGRHLKIPEVEYFKASRIRVETERPVDVYADGEYVCRTPIELSVQWAALKVLTGFKPAAISASGQPRAGIRT